MPVTASTYFPFDAGAGANTAESGWRAMAQHWLPSGVLVTDAHPGGGLVPSAGTGLQVVVSAGAVWLQGHYGEWDAPDPLTVTANASGSTRVDAIVARVDFVANVIELDVVTGTPGAGLPALTRNASEWEFLIGQVTLASSDTTVTVADWRTLTGPTVAAHLLGEPFEFPAGTIPAWALELNGQAVSRTQYASLFTLWGTTFGSGNGSTTFNVPDRRGRVAVGQNTSDSDFDTVGETGGAKTHTLTTAQIPSHSHSAGTLATVSAGEHTHTLNGGPNHPSGTFVQETGMTDASLLPTNSAGAHTHTITGSTGSIGSGGSHNNLQPYQVTRWICRAR